MKYLLPFLKFKTFKCLKTMSEKPLKELTPEELNEEIKQMRRNEIFHAFSIGLMGGVIIYSVIQNTWVLVTLTPLFFIYKLIRQSDRYKELKQLIKDRNAF